MTRRLWPSRIPLFGLGFLLLVLSIISLFRGPSDWQPPPRAPGEEWDEIPDSGDQGGQMPFLPETAYNNIVLNNLFSATRTPPPEMIRITDGPAAGSQELALLGVILSGERQTALIGDRASGDVTPLEPGASYRGWELVSLTAETAELRRDGERLTLSLLYAPDTIAASPSVPSAAARPRIPIEPRAGDAQGNPVRARRQTGRRN